MTLVGHRKIAPISAKMLISVKLLTNFVIIIIHQVQYMKSSASESKPFQRPDSGLGERTAEPFQI